MYIDAYSKLLYSNSIRWASLAKYLSMPAHIGLPQPVVGSHPFAAGKPLSHDVLESPVVISSYASPAPPPMQRYNDETRVHWSNRTGPVIYKRTQHKYARTRLAACNHVQPRAEVPEWRQASAEPFVHDQRPDTGSRRTRLRRTVDANGGNICMANASYVNN